MIDALYSICHGPRRISVTCAARELEWAVRNLLLCGCAIHSIEFVKRPPLSEESPQFPEMQGASLVSIATNRIEASAASRRLSGLASGDPQDAGGER